MDGQDSISLREINLSGITLFDESISLSSSAMNFERPGGLPWPLEQNYPSCVIDIFAEVETTVDMFQVGCALKGTPRPGYQDVVLVHDLSLCEGPDNSPRLRVKSGSFELDKLLRSDDIKVLIRIIFLEIDTITIEGLRRLGCHYSIPAAFWGSNSNGCFGTRTSKPTTDETIHTTWLEILTKPEENHYDNPDFDYGGIYWYRPCFSLKWHRYGKGSKKERKVTVFCLDSSPNMRERFAQVMKHTDAQLILEDPYLIYALISTEWLKWNQDAYFRLRRGLLKIEHIANDVGGKFEPDFPGLHTLARNIIQMMEVSQSAISVMELLVKEHKKLFEVFGGKGDAYERAEATLDTQLALFKGALSSYEALHKRLMNLINFAFNVVAQRDSNIAVEIGKATQSDSTSMRSIAIVTLVFLPGTAIASIFGTPFFSSRDTRTILGSDFWIFWAITLPITFVTLMIWYIIDRGRGDWLQIPFLWRKTQSILPK